MVDNADDFSSVMDDFHDWAFSESKNICLASWGIWDIPVLRTNYANKGVIYRFRGKSFDIKSMVVFYMGLIRRRYKSDSLSAVLKAWGLEFEGSQHRALADAKNTALLLKAVIQYHHETQEHIVKAAKRLDLSTIIKSN